ncbi:MAG: NAD(P)-dependent glycerol-3-phosphate dehydrogenase [Comamonadaceae bacterium]|nr:MAG: NAD(P)-dependent glycerol-3-phosphate dehydrogenase [Comamonadaceae bacterium]
MRLTILGAGAWGTALAVNAATRNGVTLWARDGAQAAQMIASRFNTRYLPDAVLPDRLRILAGSALEAVAMSDLIVVASPMASLRSQLELLRHAAAPVIWLCKGLEHSETGSGLFGHEIARQVAPELPVGVLSGPSFAQEVAAGRPTALVASSPNPSVRDAIVRAFHGPNLRVYANDDMPGVEVGGAVKNVLAIATGLCDGMNLGLNARAALLTRGLAEMTRLGVALGARPETFMGLSGLGDLVLTATGDLSRNRRVGILLAQGRTTDEAVASLGHVAEGVYCAHSVARRAEQLGIDMPIARSVVALLNGTSRADRVLAELMNRDPATEPR